VERIEPISTASWTRDDVTDLITARPQVAVSAGIFRDRRILLTRRTNNPKGPLWTFPGGHIEANETIAEALKREILEETGLTIEIAGSAGVREMLHAQSGHGHFIILPFAAYWVSGEVTLNDELEEFRWFDPDETASLMVTDGLHNVIAAARGIVGI
jgi:8-oxo-dGTP pyrophosphatase MutT (NUDIX family)